MHTVYDRESVLKIKYGRLIVETTAIWKDKKMLVQVIDFKLGIKTKGVYYATAAGYGIVFDNERIIANGYSYYGSETVEKNTWTKYESERLSPYVWDNRCITDNEVMMICSLYPDFIYTYRKLTNGIGITDVLQFLKIWLEHKQDVEMLCALGYKHFVDHTSIYRLDKTKKDRLIKFLYKKAKTSDKRLKDAYFGISECIRFSQIDNLDLDYIALKDYFPYDVYLKCYKKLDNAEAKDYFKYHYKDYIKLAKKTEKNLKDSYWKYPKDLKTLHDKLVIEEKNYINLANKNKFQALEKRIAKYIKYNGVTNGYEIGFTADPDEWKKQASELHQCIVANEYYSKTYCILAFIRKNGVPIATAEIMANKEIGQFYANEKDRSNCKPDAKVVRAFNKWLENVKVGARI